MRILIALICILLIAITHICFASITVPFRCHEKDLIEQFKLHGYNFDKEDYNSDGFIENRGKEYKIHFYQDPENLQEFLKTHMEVERTIQGLKNADRNDISS